MTYPPRFVAAGRDLALMLWLLFGGKALFASASGFRNGSAIEKGPSNFSVVYGFTPDTTVHGTVRPEFQHQMTKRSEQAQQICSEHLDVGPVPVRPPFFGTQEKQQEWRWKYAYCIPGQAAFEVKCQQSHRNGVAIRSSVAPLADLVGRCMYPNYRCNEFEMRNFFGETSTTARCVDNARSREYIGPLYNKLQTCSYSANFYRGPGAQRTKVEVVNQAIIPNTDTGFTVKALWFEDHTLGLPGERIGEKKDVSFVDYVFYFTSAMVSVVFCAEVYPYPKGHPPNVAFRGAGVVGDPPTIPPKSISAETASWPHIHESSDEGNSDEENVPA